MNFEKEFPRLSLHIKRYQEFNYILSPVEKSEYSEYLSIKEMILEKSEDYISGLKGAIIIKKDRLSSGFYSYFYDGVPPVISQGETEVEALENLLKDFKVITYFIENINDKENNDR